MAAGGQMQGAGTGAIANPNAAQQANEVDAMQSKLNELKNL